jgi:hypothetical protein
MKRHQFERSPAEDGSCAAGTRWHRMRRAAFVHRWACRSGKRDAATDIDPAIQCQLRTLRPVCSAQRVSTGATCGSPAVAVAEIHALDGCKQMGLTARGDLVETLCQACLVTLQRAMSTYVSDKREMASRCGTYPVCSTCGRQTRYLSSVFAVRQIWPEGLAL